MIDVRMLCLAALMGHEASGYDIKKELEKGGSTGLVDASFGSIYPALARLAEDGLITARTEGGRGRTGKTIYAITAEGRAHFLKTLSGPIPEEKYRSPFLFAMLFADELPRERVRVMIDQQIAQWEEKIAAVEASRAAGPGGAGASFVFGFGEATLRAGLEFLKRHRRAVEMGARDAAPPAPTQYRAGDRPDAMTEPAAAAALRTP
ncbi:MAG: PadR family transcriptional regulator [Alphaproteobacteria bacterium]|nr:PadR family transcriptional regulator [Alphaproteobacteria bacterium]